MAATVSPSFSLDPQPQHHYFSHFKPHQTLPFTSSPLFPKYPLLTTAHKHNRYAFKSSSSSSHSTPSTTATSSSSFLEDPFRTGRFLSNEELEKLKLLEDFRYYQELESGSLWIRVMRAEEMDNTVALLAESFAESMVWPSGYLSLLRFLVKQYLIERRALMPHTATLIGFYREKENERLEHEEEEEEEEEEELAGTVEVCFDKRGANASPPTPTPPKNSPYICNMSVDKPLRRSLSFGEECFNVGYKDPIPSDFRTSGYIATLVQFFPRQEPFAQRRGIGWHLLKASEELISQMNSTREVYLHCRMIDAAPFNMYIKAGYKVVNTDSIFILLMLQRRKHLMCKKLPVLRSPFDMSDSDEE